MPLRADSYIAIAELHRFASMRGQIGYHMSAKLLDSVATQIELGLPCCIIGRVGRNSVEFVFSASSGEDAASRLNALSHAIETDIEIDGCHIGLVTHFGAVPIGSGHGMATDYLLHQAEAALATAQTLRHRASVGMVHEEGDLAHATTIALRDFPKAIAEGELQLYYQPKLHCRTDRIVSVEALLRWHHPVHGLVNTQEMIEIAEVTGAIRDLTKWVIAQAVHDQFLLDEAGFEVSIDVNISGSLLANAEMTQWALARLCRPARPMGIEVTETAVIEDPEQAIANLRQFADAGIRVAIDDYGAGLSSLVYLKQLPAHELKIDRCFVSGLTESHRDPLIIRSTIDLAHALEMEVTAEGVNDPLALGLLRAMGCDIVQGYLIAAPMPFDQLCTFLVEWEGSAHHAPEPMLKQVAHNT